MLLPATCPVCGRRGAAPCAICRRRCRRSPPLPVPPGLDGCQAVWRYEGTARELVARLKYRNARSSLTWLADQMAELVDPSSVDVVTWVPTTTGRRRQRGFDQAELLARAVAKRRGLPAARLLRRWPGPSQTGRTVEQRWHGPRFSARVAVPEHVLLVDDVVTTGATMAAAARALRHAGARSVTGLAAARTAPRTRPSAA